MKRNEKILAGLLGLFLGGYLLKGPIESVTTGPVDALRSTRDDRSDQAATFAAKRDALTRAAARVNDARARSLPADVSYAERLYPQWLQDMATASGWIDVRTELRPVQPRRGEQFRPVRVELRGFATLTELDTFLRRFRRTALLQRINSCKVFSASETGDGDLDVLIEAEAVSLPTATDREEIFPVARLLGDLPVNDEAANMLVPSGLSGAFPQEPGFVVRAGTEFLTVTDVEPLTDTSASEPADGEGTPVRWTFERAAEGSESEAHPAGTLLQLWPQTPPPRDALAFSETGPFRKPRSYDPRWRIVGPTRLVRGEPLSLSVDVEGFDPRGGEPTLSAGELPEGATFDAAAGRLVWNPPADLPPGQYDATLSADVPKPSATLTESLALTLVERNTPPTVTSVEPQSVNAGDVLLFVADASDAEDGLEVDFSLVNPPEGALIDPAFGVVRWSVPRDYELGTTTLTVRVTDQGSPSLSGETTVQVTVTEDLRPFVKFVGRTTRNGEDSVTLFNQAENQITKLREGDPFSLAGVTGEVLEISRDSMEYSRDGRRYALDLGRSLAEAVELEDPAPAAAEEAATKTDVEEVATGDGTTDEGAAGDGSVGGGEGEEVEPVDSDDAAPSRSESVDEAPETDDSFGSPELN